MPSEPCPRCGAAIPPPRRPGRPRKWCSESCRVAEWKAGQPSKTYYAIFHNTCETCQIRWISWANGQAPRFCPPCKKADKARRERERYASDPLAKQLQVAAFRASWTSERREAEASRARAWKQQAGYYESKRISDQVRRARKRGATVERFSPLEIFERDCWTCGICDDAIDSELAWPDPLSVSLDHVVPLSRGGAHSRSNTRATHLTCNVVRGNRAA